MTLDLILLIVFFGILAALGWRWYRIQRDLDDLFGHEDEHAEQAKPPRGAHTAPWNRKWVK